MDNPLDVLVSVMLIGVVALTTALIIGGAIFLIFDMHIIFKVIVLVVAFALSLLHHLANEY